VDLIFEGRITGHQHLKDALTRIQEIAIPGISILRVSAPELDHSGRLLIKDSRLVVAALTRDGLYEGYDGVRQILATTIGHYAFLEVGPQDKVDLVPNLNIPVDSLLKALPNLPTEAGALFDEKSLLDKVFTPDAGNVPHPDPTNLSMEEMNDMPPLGSVPPMGNMTGGHGQHDRWHGQHDWRHGQHDRRHGQHDGYGQRAIHGQFSRLHDTGRGLRTE